MSSSSCRAHSWPDKKKRSFTNSTTKACSLNLKKGKFAWKIASGWILRSLLRWEFVSFWEWANCFHQKNTVSELIKFLEKNNMGLQNETQKAIQSYEINATRKIIHKNSRSFPIKFIFLENFPSIFFTPSALLSDWMLNIDALFPGINFYDIELFFVILWASGKWKVFATFLV